MSFSEWYNNKESAPIAKVGRAEKLFEEAVGQSINSLDAFISYLILNKKISGTVKMKHKAKPVSLMSLSEEKKIHHLVRHLNTLEEDAIKYNEIWHG